MISYLAFCGLILMFYWCYRIISDKDNGFFYLLFCPRTRTTDGSKLTEAVAISKEDKIYKNTFDFKSLSNEKLFNYARNCASEYKRSYLLHGPFTTAYNIIKAEDLEDVMKDPGLISKGRYYHFLDDFLGEGLLISSGSKWHSRRKLLTPSFHFNILEKFLEIFKNESLQFLTILDSQKGEAVSLQKTIPKSILNVICESALGVKLNELQAAEEYRKTIKKIEHLQIERAGQLIMYADLIYKWFGKKREYEKECEEAHKFTSSIINSRREDFKSVYNVGKRSKFALLDNLLLQEKEGLIDHKGICEEVDTLTFEGFDTTSTAIIFTLFLLGQHQDVQEKVYEELCTVMKDEMNLLDYSNFKYLESVIKESLRLYPPVPYISRVVTQDSVCGKLILPKHAEISIHIFDIHRDPNHFLEPEKFDPDRFLPENTKNRHPFAYIPFSAGLRNCIGQRFAMLELKILLSTIVKEFRIVPVTERKDLKFEAGLILRTMGELFVKFERRV
ncbi:hypothetical protein ACFFRR_006136 [Megaselia abdita]